MINYNYKVMESGTVLHLALLKKLSNHYPAGELNSKYHHFKQNSPHPHSPRHLPRPYQPYRTPGENESTARPRRLRLERKFERVVEEWRLMDSLTAWNTDNQQQVSYTEKLKRDQYHLFPKLQDQRPTKNKIHFRKDASSKEPMPIGKLHNLVVEDISKTTASILIPKQKPRTGLQPRKAYSQDKENSTELKPAATAKHTRRAKSNDRFLPRTPLLSDPRTPLTSNANTLLLQD